MIGHVLWIAAEIVGGLWVAFFVVMLVITAAGVRYARRHGGQCHVQKWPLRLHIVLDESGSQTLDVRLF